MSSKVKIEDKFFMTKDDLTMCIPIPVLKDIAGSDLIEKFEKLSKKYIELRGGTDGLNSECDFGIVGTISNYVVYENKPFKTFNACKASVSLAKVAIQIMKAAKAKGFCLKLAYSSYMPLDSDSKFTWVLANSTELFDFKLTDKGKKLYKKLANMGWSYPGLYFDSATIVQP